MTSPEDVTQKVKNKQKLETDIQINLHIFALIYQLPDVTSTTYWYSSVFIFRDKYFLLCTRMDDKKADLASLMSKIKFEAKIKSPQEIIQNFYIISHYSIFIITFSANN